ncbi:pyroglutamyl-peptidase I Cysteine peptidase. MEROPS family C15 [Ligilactobacillus sp. WC1T17]|uniref:Pyrrolidone-carboxylate peptidase n=1 Tax=Ligilactobacillus ruminis TaxID=1623 RepID=A0ABY1AAQ8_9LACO|nr:pyroglutamyl-peptidase I Cysteine peptidase. MEROPS family C15 [Ligilactobacillus ruminis]
MKILVTGFDPFGKETINPALEAVKRLPDEILGAQIIKLEIPTSFDQSAQVVHAAIQKNQPDYVLNVGQAGGRAALTPERVAINLDDASIADNAGVKPLNRVIEPTGQTAYFTQLPIKAMVKMIREAGLPAQISNTAGTFVCNHIMYQVQYMRANEFPQLKAGFIHIPYLPQQVIAKPHLPSMSLDDSIKGLTQAIGAIVKWDGQEDLQNFA